MWPAGLCYGDRGHLLGCATPTDGVFLPVLCTGQPCVSSLDSQGTSHSLVHLTMRAACVVKDSGTSLVFFEGQDRPPPLPVGFPIMIETRHQG